MYKKTLIISALNQISRFGFITVTDTRKKLLSHLSEEQQNNIRDFDELSSTFTPTTFALQQFQRCLSTRNSNLLDHVKTTGEKKGLRVDDLIMRGINFEAAKNELNSNFRVISVFTV